MNLPLSMALAAAFALGASGQDAPQNVAPTGKPRQELEVQAPRAPKTSEVSTNALAKPQPPEKPTKSGVTLGGLVTDVRKSTNRWKMFSLRRPANVKEDDKAVIRDLRTEGGGAVKIFSVDF